ncbi:MAG: CRISPR system precrRNA processing endoribonuclease RAMP protein Cas6 [Chthonomonadales bacterium]|nr:CRISPR system precrRNA processing endoribonuclease RAMP protein Cas6 [Chthonomonadales bacterium]
MPARVRLVLDGPKPAGPHRHADGLRAVVLAAIGRSDPALGRWLHDANQPKPIAVGPLEPGGNSGGSWAVEISVTADEVLQPLLDGLPRLRCPITLGRDRYALRDARIVAASTFAGLSADLPTEPAIRLRLLTPTAHHQPGTVRRSIVVPDPRLYVGSWFGRWNLFADTRLDDALLSAVEEAVVISAFVGGTRAARLDGKRVFIGFVGDVELRIIEADRTVAPLAAALWSLARFAEYCGTGVETMRGMGQTRIIRG